MKKNFLDIGVLFSALSLFTFPTLTFSQQSDSTHIDAIEYYYLRIATGFGAGVDQAIDTEGGSSREYLTRPFLYWGLSDKLSFALSNQTIWSNAESYQFNPTDSQNEGYNASHFSQIALNAVLANSFFVHASADFSNRLPYRIDFSSEDADFKQFQLSGFYLSRDGMLEYAPNQRALVYYGTNWFDETFFPQLGLASLQNPLTKELLPAIDLPLSLFSKGQTFVAFSGFANTESLTSPSFIPVDAFTYREDSNISDTQRESVNIQIGHGLLDNLNFGAVLQYFHSDSKNVQSDALGSVFDQFNSDSKTYSINGWVEQIFRQNWRQRLSLAIAGLSSEYVQPDFFGAAANQSYTQKYLNANYTLQHLWNAPAPGMATFLADRDDLFGHRLPKGGWQLLGSAGWAFNFDRDAGQSKNDSKRFSLALVNGRSSQLEMGVLTSIDRYSSENAPPGSELPYSKTISAMWNYGLVFNFANYRLSEDYHRFLGWNELSQFDRLYGSLLRPGMVKLTIGALHGFEYLHNVQRINTNGIVNSDNSDWHPRDVQFYGRVRVGLKWGMELDMSVAEAAEVRNVAFSAPLLRSLRLRAEYNSSIFDRDFFFSNRSLSPNSFVNVRLIGLF